MDFMFCGSWDASSGEYPIIPSNVKNGYYYIIKEGYINNTFFDIGDWLIFIWDEISEIGTFYKSEKGIIQINVNYLPKIGEKRFTYTKVVVDENGNFIDGGSLTKLDIPQHTHSPEITPLFVNLVRKSLSNFPLNKTERRDFFCNTPVSKTVKFEYDEENLGVRADVKIDEITLIKDEYGYLKVNKDILNKLLPWQSFFPYKENDLVYVKKNDFIYVYLCQTPHTSSEVFNNDEEKWVFLFTNYIPEKDTEEIKQTITYKSKLANGQFIVYDDWQSPKLGFKFFKKGRIKKIYIRYQKGSDRRVMLYKNDDLLTFFDITDSAFFIEGNFEFRKNDLVKFFIENKKDALQNVVITFDVVYDETV